jgi:hypothetical protein
MTHNLREQSHGEAWSAWRSGCPMAQISRPLHAGKPAYGLAPGHGQTAYRAIRPWCDFENQSPEIASEL